MNFWLVIRFTDKLQRQSPEAAFAAKDEAVAYLGAMEPIYRDAEYENACYPAHQDSHEEARVLEFKDGKPVYGQPLLVKLIRHSDPTLAKT